MSTLKITGKSEFLRFVWQHILLLASLYVMTLGVALCVRSGLGSSVISALPMAFSVAGTDGLAPGLTIGMYTNIMNVCLVLAQFLILRRRFELVQLFQLVIGFVFGALIDINMALTAVIDYDTVAVQAGAQALGCTVMAFGISMEVRCGSVTMPGEGIQVAVSRAAGMPFAKTKIIVDCTLVALAVASCYAFWGEWKWSIIGPGTLFAMFYVGWMVKVFGHHMGWFDRLLDAAPGIGRFVYGLARYIKIRR